MIITVHQPQYIPWIGYFDKIDKSDIFIILDNVQYKKNEWQNRNRIKTANEWQWLTVPVHFKFPEKINNVTINNKTDWQRKHLNALITNYSKSKYFNKYFPFFEDLYKKKWEYLVDINTYIIKSLLDFLNIKKEVKLSSQIDSRDDPNKRLIDICKHFKADTYLAGTCGANYMDLDLFLRNNIKVEFQDYNHPNYHQLFENFISHMSIIDLLFNHGEDSINILRGKLNEKKR